MKTEVKNPIDESKMLWINNEYTIKNHGGMDVVSSVYGIIGNARLQKALSLEYVLEMGKGVLDIGAHLGDYGIPLALALKNLGREDIMVYCIEPTPEKCEFMNEVIKLNNLDDTTIKVINKGLSDASRKFDVSPEAKMECGINTGGWQWIPNEDGDEFTTLDHL